ncbi:MAG: endonuclease/exonuclease/phosphatase family protein [Acidobacteria bacterium]|nr:MAG: endonuclease/exonuclease/phosphatase family protein [Acidobacteriota bacterium]
MALLDRRPLADGPLPVDFPLVWRKVASDTSSSSSITIVTLNTARETSLTRILRDFSRLERSGPPDILLLQEVKAPRAGNANATEQLAARLGFNYLYQPANLWKDGSREGLAIVSRYPLVDPAVIRLPALDLVYNNRRRIALSATAVTPLGRVRLFNVHLDTRVGIRDRLAQLAPVVAQARAVSGPCVVAGDFNTSHFAWFGRVLPIPYQDQEIRVRRHFQATGFRTPFVHQKATFDLLGLRLDSIYVKGLEWAASGIEEIDFSDHHALWVSLRADKSERTGSR